MNLYGGSSPAPAMALAQDRQRARSLATRIVSAAIGLVGVVLILFAFFLTFTGGVALLFLSIILFVMGALIAGLGFFFQLVPLRVDALAREKREYDQRAREAEAESPEASTLRGDD